ADLEATLAETEGVENVISVAGFSLLQSTITPSGGMAIASLAPWDQRESEDLQLSALIGRLQGAFAAIPGANVAVFAPPAIPGIGAVGGLDLRLQALRGQPPEEIAQVLRSFLA